MGRDVSKEVRKKRIIKHKKRNILRNKFIPYIFLFITLFSIIGILGLLAKQMLSKNTTKIIDADDYSIQNNKR
jgi:hypothetical protein